MNPAVVTFFDSAAQIWRELLTSPLALVPVVLFVALALAGRQVKRRDEMRFRRMRWRWFGWGSLLLALSAIGLAALMIVGPEKIQVAGGDIWQQRVSAFALASVAGGLVLLVAGAGFAFGGLLGGFGTTLRPARAIVIAIDGPAASGKGTLAKRIAEFYRLECLDTGLLYRAVARDVLAKGGRLEDAAAGVVAAMALDPATLGDRSLRTVAVGEAASVVAKFPAVRAALLDYQRAFSRREDGAVLDGRDIGTVVCPNASVKIYVTASPEERARRRHRELGERGDKITFEAVLADIKRRDSRDVGRAVSPLLPADDAIVLDTTALDADAAFNAALRIIASRLTPDE